MVKTKPLITTKTKQKHTIKELKKTKNQQNKNNKTKNTDIQTFDVYFISVICLKTYIFSFAGTVLNVLLKQHKIFQDQK